MSICISSIPSSWGQFIYKHWDKDILGTKKEYLCRFLVVHLVSAVQGYEITSQGYSERILPPCFVVLKKFRYSKQVYDMLLAKSQ